MMSNKMTCEEFNERLTEFVIGRSSAAEGAAMQAHMEHCVGCEGIYEIKRSLIIDSPAVPDEVERDLVDVVLSDVAAAREAGRPRRSWASRFIMPAMAAAIVIFVFLTGFMLGEIRSLHREAGELREEVSIMEAVLAGGAPSPEGAARGRSVFGRMTGGLTATDGMTIGEAARFLETLPENTPVLTEEEAKRLISGNRRLSRFAGQIEERPWEGGLTSGELLLVIMALKVDPDTKIPDEWTIRTKEI